MKLILLTITVSLGTAILYGQQPVPTATPRLKSLRTAEKYRMELEMKFDKGKVSRERYREEINHYKQEVSRLLRDS